MDDLDLRVGRPELPDGYLAVPVRAQDAESPVRVCVVARRGEDPVGGRLVLRRDMIDARVYLGCLCDAAGSVHRWLEVWVQSIEGLEGAPPAYREALSNAVLDERWVRFARALREIDPEVVFAAAWETINPAPTLLDVRRAVAVHPVDRESGQAWALCTDESILSQRGVPAYGSSLHRYLYLPDLGSDSPLVGVTPGAPEGDRTEPISTVLGAEASSLEAFNLHCGLMLAREMGAVGVESLADLLGGAPVEGIAHGRTIMDLGALAGLDEPEASQPRSEGWLFLARSGRAGRVLEGLHLRLRLIADAVGQVRSVVRRTQRPLLNVSPESFQVRLFEPGAGLPFLWNWRVLLADPGQAVALSIEGSDERYFLHASGDSASIYHPTATRKGVRGEGSFRIRQVKVQTTDATVVVDGTFSSQERIDPSQSDLAWLRLNISGSRIDLYGRLEQASALASGEWRFRTIRQRLGEGAIAALGKAEGVPMSGVPFEVLPLLSAPCDLYALGVMGVRALLVDGQSTLPVALDEMLSLARQVAVEYDDSMGLGLRIQGIMDNDQRWVQSLGPQRLCHEQMDADEAFGLVPVQLWCDVLGAIVRMFPGMGPDSACQDFGEVRPGALHRVFDTAASDLQDLLVRTRGVIVSESSCNDEIHAVIGRLSVQVGA